MFEISYNRKLRAEKEKLINDIIDFFESPVKYTKGSIKVFESNITEDVVIVRINVGPMTDTRTSLQDFSQIIKDIYSMSIEPKSDRAVIYIAVDDAFEK